MTLSIALSAAGGLALFLLAMQMMTDGLKAFAGARLKQLLERWTSTPARGVVAGMLVTGLVQSSSAVTVMSIGFVNAGVLTLRQALGVIFGANVGTTMTGWLVSLVGFGFRIESFALPILTVGVGMRLVLQDKRRQGLGEALAGFGLFFLGLAVLKDAFAGLAESYGSALAAGSGVGGVLTLVLAGFIATVLTQSSSAAIALILTAASGGVVAVDQAAAAVIGANLGTTSTAAFAVIKATPAAKRLAIGHIAFNLVTAVVALALLPALIWGVAQLADGLDVDGRPAAVLALFHTVFNVIGVVLMLPVSERLARMLERLFRSAEEEVGRPRYLDATLAATPELAVSALGEELRRLLSVVGEIAQESLTGGGHLAAVAGRAEAARTLAAAIGSFIAKLGTERMPRDVADELARSLRTERYLEEAARLVPSTRELRAATDRLAAGEARDRLLAVFAAAGACAAIARRPEAADEDEAARAVVQFRASHEAAKSALLTTAVAGQRQVDTTVAMLDLLSHTRRMTEQLTKADRMLGRGGASAARPDGDAEAEDDA